MDLSKNTNNIQVSVVIVNYKNPPLILQCVKSIMRFEKTVEYEIIVVDNNSEDDTEQQLRAIYPNLKWIQMGYNSGFAKANNAGLRVAQGKYIFFLNSDTIFLQPIFERMVEYMERTKDLGILGCQLLNKDGSLQLSYHNGDLFFQKLWRRNPFAIKIFNALGKNSKDDTVIRNNHSRVHNTRWLCGAALLIKKSVLEENNFYWSEEFFMYWEDVELCYRIRKKGLQVIYMPCCNLVHLGGASSSFSDEKFIRFESSKLTCIEGIYGKLVLKIYKCLLKLGLKLEVILERRKYGHIKNTMLQQECEFYNLKV